MEMYIAIAAIMLFTFALVGVAIMQERKRSAAWREVAARLGLGFSGKQIIGTLDDVSVQVFLETRGSGKQQSIYTVFQADLDPNSIPDGLDLAKEHMLLKLGKVVGMKDVQLDLPGLDEHIMVRAHDEHAVREWARRSDVSRALADIVAMRAFNFRVVGSQLTLDRRGSIADGSLLESRLSEIAKLARALSGKGYGGLLDDGHW